MGYSGKYNRKPRRKAVNAAMANEQNLVPFTSMQSREEAVKNGRKGGIASGKAKREKADMRKMAQAILDGTFEDKNGTKFTGRDLVQKGIMANLSDPNGRNWSKAMDLLVMLTGANITPEQRENIKASTEKIKAETKRMQVDDKQENTGKLAELIEGLKEDDIYTETASSNADVADGTTETTEPA